MIRLERVRLINWHNFVNDTLDFDQITYMIGVNAVGKTTILDAIRYCITTSKKFNALGNKRSGRTLQGSVHGKQRGENIYTRPGHTVSYVGIEFSDSMQKGASFVITVRVESEQPEQELRHIRQTWYISPRGIRLENLPFLDENNTPTSRDRFCLPDGGMSPLERQSDAQDQIYRALGIGRYDSPLGKKFNTVFPMGTCLDDIPDFKTFIYDYILPAPDINLDSMQQDGMELEHLQEVLLEAQKRAKQLKDIVEAGNQAQKQQEALIRNQGLMLYAQFAEKSGKEQEILSALDQCQRKQKKLEADYELASQAAEEAQADYDQANRDSANCDERRALDELRRNDRELLTRLGAAKNRMQDFRNACASIENLLDETLGDRFEAGLRPSAIIKMPKSRQDELQARLSDQLRQLDEDLDRERMTLSHQQQDCKNRLEELQKKIQALSGGRLIYPDSNAAETVKNAINTALEKQGMEPDAKILCDILYMTDESWQNCVEACLGHRRFDILVSAKHYRTAKYVFEQMGKQVRRVSLLDSVALERDLDRIQKPREDRLCAKVRSENRLARAYVTDLLREIVCCEDSETLENYPHSVTKDLLRHYPYRLTRMEKQANYIGRNARLEQLAQAQEEFSKETDLRQDLEHRLKTIKNQFDRVQDILRGSTLSHLSAGWDSEEKYEQCKAESLSVRAQIADLEKNPILCGLLDRMELLRKKLADRNREKEEIQIQRGRVQRDAEAQEARRSFVLREAQETRKLWEDYLLKYPLWQREIEESFQGSALSVPQLLADQARAQQQLQKALREQLDQTLIPLQQAYNQRYTCDFPLGMDGMEDFQNQYAQLTQSDLERYGAKLQSARERCKERFRKDVLFRLKDDIANAKAQFKELNRVMEKLTYGEEFYRFSIGPSADPLLSAFYQVIVHSANQSIPEEGTLFAMAQPVDEAYEAQVEDLMEHIMVDLRQAAEDRQQGKQVATADLSSYVDYRRYLSYDIQVTNTVTKQTTPLSLVSGDSSGGENQAPFYIAICASLLQIYQKRPNSIRLVLLDEAFSKMTTDRIQPMMRMFRDMDLQVVLITTVEKASAIYPYCDITHSVVKYGSRNAVQPFYLVEE